MRSRFMLGVCKRQTNGRDTIFRLHTAFSQCNIAWGGQHTCSPARDGERCGNTMPTGSAGRWPNITPNDYLYDNKNGGHTRYWLVSGPPPDTPNTVKLQILEWPFIVASLRHTCVVIMLANQHLDMPHLWDGWIISAKKKCSLTQI